MTQEKNPHGFTHYIECTKCLQPGIYLKHKPQPGDPVFASRVFFEDGTSPQPNEKAECQYCGFRLTLHKSQLKEVGND